MNRFAALGRDLALRRPLTPEIDLARQNPTQIGDAIVFAVPILGTLHIDAVGQLYLNELLLAVLFPMLLLRRGRLPSLPGVRLIVTLALVWLGSQILTDIIRHTPAHNFLRGWANIGLFIVDFLSMTMLLTTLRRVVLWILAGAIEFLILPFELRHGGLGLLDAWKFGLGASILTLLYLPSLRRVFAQPEKSNAIRRIEWLQAGMGAFSFFLNARSFAGLSILASGMLMLYRRYRGTILSPPRIALGGALALVAVYGLASIYAHGASSGFFGADAQAKYRLQEDFGGGPLGLLLGGRSEILVSKQAVEDSPWIGHGSWASDYKYLVMYAAILASVGSKDRPNLADDFSGEPIPSHSYLMGAWVNAGILGAVFWFGVVLFALLRVFPAAWRGGSPLSVYALMTMPTLLWNIFFSPFGAYVRVSLGGLLAIYCVLLATSPGLGQRGAR